MAPYNPYIRYYEGDRRGYFAARVTEKQMEADLRFVTSVEDRNGSGYPERTFVVESGKPGALGA
jgi:alkaline phosphatase D